MAEVSITHLYVARKKFPDFKEMVSCIDNRYCMHSMVNMVLSTFADDDT